MNWGQQLIRKSEELWVGQLGTNVANIAEAKSSTDRPVPSDRLSVIPIKVSGVRRDHALFC